MKKIEAPMIIARSNEFEILNRISPLSVREFCLYDVNAEVILLFSVLELSLLNLFGLYSPRLAAGFFV